TIAGSLPPTATLADASRHRPDTRHAGGRVPLLRAGRPRLRGPSLLPAVRVPAGRDPDATPRVAGRSAGLRGAVAGRDLGRARRGPPRTDPAGACSPASSAVEGPSPGGSGSYGTTTAGRPPRKELTRAGPSGPSASSTGTGRSTRRPALSSAARRVPGSRPDSTGGVHQTPPTRTATLATVDSVTSPRGLTSSTSSTSGRLDRRRS